MHITMCITYNCMLLYQICVYVYTYVYIYIYIYIHTHITIEEIHRTINNKTMKCIIT